MKAFFLVSSLAVSVVALLSCHPSQESSVAPKPSPIAVKAAPVPWSDIPAPVVAPGLLARTMEADLSFKTGGVIAEVSVRAGDEVVAGQVLGALRMEELDAAVAQADSVVTKAKRDLERFAGLVVKNVEPLEKQQNAESAVEQAEAGLRAARFNQQTAVLTAPASGQVLARFAEPGEIAAAGRTILRFASDAEGWLVRVGLAQRDVVRIHVGDSADVNFAGLREPLMAEVARIAGEADPSSRTTLVELRLTQPPPAELRSGMVARAQLQPGKRAPQALMPFSALVEGDGKLAHVFRVSKPCRDGEIGIVRRVLVEIEELTEAGAVVRSGWDDRSAMVVITGAELLADGMEVLVNPGSPLASN